ncbi:MAG: ABC transporter permease subunit [Phycisphaerae bacterium]|nr:ABC transporter permease subunit [Phycisphaerae bacterium]
MSNVAAQLSAWAWHLIPANPIVLRVVQGSARRSRHLWLRFGYLAVLFFVVLFGAFSFSTNLSLDDLAKQSSVTFSRASIAQLMLMCFLAPVFTAGAITQERDSQTFNILLSTPLSNAQIVLGSLLSRLFFVVVLLLAGLPIFFVTTIYGGVTTSQIIESFAIAGGTAVLTGSLAIAISMIRVGTRRTIFSFYITIGLYLLTVYALGTQWSGTWVAEAPANVSGERMSWLAPFHPFLALDVALNRIQAPPFGALGNQSAVVRYLLAYPQALYVALTLALSFLLTVVSMFFVRRSALEGETSFFGKLADRIRRRPAGDRTQKPRRVWRNPIAWREAATRATAASRGVVRYAIIGGGIAAAALVLIEYHRGTLNTVTARVWLANIIMIEFGIILLVAINTAATAITKERESQTMDILLATPLSAKDLVWGKLRGLVSFTAGPICVPVGTLLVFGLYDLFRDIKVPVVSIEVWFELMVLLLAYAAFACMLGMHFSLRIKQTVKAVMVSVGVMALLCLVAGGLAQAIIGSLDAGGAFIAAFTPFTAISVLVNPVTLFGDVPQKLAANLDNVRGFAVIGSAIAALVVCGIVAGMYKSMVRNFDMIIRKQSGQ